MSQPIIIAHHIMWTCYGWWLPNDLRGSTSEVIRNDVLKELGELHYGRKQVQAVEPLIAQGIRPAHHQVWSQGGGWKVFLDHPNEVRRTIGYIERNPLPWRLPVQCYDFVKQYDGWPLHPGHSPNSPYVKALRAVGRYP